MIAPLKQGIRNILLWSQKYTKTDMLYLAKGGFWLTFGQVASSAASFLLAIAFANLIPKETYGTYRYVLSIAGLLGVSTLQGMEAAITQAVARGQDGMLLPALRTKIKFGILGSLASIGFAGYYATQHNFTLTAAFIIVAASIPFLNSLAIYTGFLKGKKLFKTVTAYETIGQIIVSTVLLMGIFLTDNLLVLIMIFLTMWIFVRFIFLRRTLSIFSASQEKFDKDIISYGKHISAPNILAAISGSIDNIVLFHFLGAPQLAVYSFALSPINQLRSLTDKITTLTVPKLANRSISEIGKLLWRRSFLMLLLGSVIALVYILSAPFIFSLFFKNYLDSVRFSQVFSLTFVLGMSQAVLAAALGAKLTDTPKRLLYLWNIPSIVLTISIILLIKPFGIMGVIASRLISTASSIIIGVVIWRIISKRAADLKIESIS